MRLTDHILTAELTVLALLDDAPRWSVWRDTRDRRTPHHPTALAIHIPTRLVLAVYVRPRHVHPSERPDPSWLPADVLPVVWHPALRPQVRTWLAHPDTTPPGLIGAAGSGPSRAVAARPRVRGSLKPGQVVG